MSVPAIAVDRSNPKTIYVGTEDSGIFKSKDGGASWVAVNDGFAGNGLVKSTDGGKRMYACSLAGGILTFRSR